MHDGAIAEPRVLALCAGVGGQVLECECHDAGLFDGEVEPGLDVNRRVLHEPDLAPLEVEPRDGGAG